MTTFTSNSNSLINSHIGNYFITNLLGKGSFSRVYRAVNIDNNNEIALKIYRCGYENIKYFEQEIRILTYLKNTENFYNNDINYLLLHDESFCILFNDKNQKPYISPVPIITYPLLYEDMYECMDILGTGFPLVDVKNLCKQILYGIRYLHINGIIHADIKPKNIILTSPAAKTDNKDLKIKIIDLGSATFADEVKSTSVGSDGYRSPEILLDIIYSYSTDIWSFGCIVFDLITSEALFVDNVDNSSQKKIGSSESGSYSYSDSSDEFDADERYGGNSSNEKSSNESNSSNSQISFQTFVAFEEFLGKMSKELLKKKKDNPYFNTKGNLKENPQIESKSIANILEKFYLYNQEDALSVERFMRSILYYVPEERPTADEILHYPFLN